MGYAAPDFVQLKTGKSRAEIETILGAPVNRLLSRPGTTVDVYEYTTVANPSVLRGLGYFVRSLFTLSAGELLFEDRTKTLTHQIRVTYDKREEAVEIRQLDTFADDVYRQQFTQ